MVSGEIEHEEVLGGLIVACGDHARISYQKWGDEGVISFGLAGEALVEPGKSYLEVAREGMAAGEDDDSKRVA
ncbi:hypothetical protein Dimus_018414, partial [Dionaea muscipula]